MKVLDVKALHQGIDELLKVINTHSGEVQQIERAVQAIVALEDALSGKGGEAIRSFYRDFHLPFLNVLQQFLNDYEQVLLQVRHSLQAFEPATDGYIRQDFIEEELDRGLEDIKQITMELTHEANSIMQRVQDIVSLPRIDDGPVLQSVKKCQDKSQETVQMLHDFDQRETSRLEPLHEALNILTQYVNKISSMFQSGDLSIGNYSPSQLSDVVEYQALLKAVEKDFFEMYAIGKNKYSEFTVDPINIASGNFIYEHTDLVIPGSSPIALTRFYNSQGNVKGLFGYNWSFTYGLSVTVREDNACIVTFNDGHRELFVEDEDSYISPKGSLNTLNKEEDGSYTLSLPTKETYVFNELGHLMALTDGKGAEIQLTYNDKNQLTHVESISGKLTFNYNKEGFISSIQDHSGREWHYTYYRGNLIGFTDSEEQTIRYLYDYNHQIIKVTSPNGQGTVVNKYDNQGRVIKQIAPNGGVTELTYKDNGFTTIVKDARGNETTYKHDHRYRLVKKINALGHAEYYTYNDQNHLVQYMDRRGNHTNYVYDEQGHCIRVEDALGQVMTMEYTESGDSVQAMTLPDGAQYAFEYDDQGRLIQETNPLQHSTTYEYNDKGQMIGLTLPNGEQIKSQIDERGNMAAVINPLNHMTRYEYDPLNRLKKMTNAKGHQFYYTYDANHRITGMSDPEGYSIQITYNEHGKVDSVIDQEGFVTRYTYDEFDQLITMTDPAGNKTTYEYDEVGNVIRAIDANGHTTTYTYDAINRLQTVCDAEGYVTSYTYDENDNVIKIVDAEGGESTFTYDALNRVVSSTDPSGATSSYAYDALGRLTKHTNAEGHSTLYTYNALGQLIEKEDANGQRTSYTYNETNAIQSITRPNGSTWKLSYDALGQLTKIVNPLGHTHERTYDETGQLKAIKNALGYETRFEYDPLERLKAVIHPDGHSKQYTYTPRGQVAIFTDENGHQTRYDYNALNLLSAVHNAQGHLTQYEYDGLSQLTQMKRYNEVPNFVVAHLQASLKQHDVDQRVDVNEWLSHHVPEQVVQYTYNVRGLLQSLVDAAGLKTNYSYNGLGQVTQMVDRDGYETTYEYDVKQQLSRIRYGDGRHISYDYNKVGQVTRMHDWNGSTHFDYDPIGQVTRIIDHDNREILYRWTATGQRESIRYPDGYEVCYEYNALDQLIQVSDDLGRTTSYAYDALGQVVSRQLPNGAKTQYQYDPLARIKKLTQLDPEQHIQDCFEYDYDAAGNRIQSITTDHEGNTTSTQYAYDPLNQLKEINHSHGERRTYYYDALGNRLAQINEEKNGTVSGQLQRYDQSNRLTQQLNLTKSVTNAVTNGGFNGGFIDPSNCGSNDGTNNRLNDQLEQQLCHYRYDGRGNLTDIFEGETLVQKHTFDASNRLVEVMNDKGIHTHYAYNGLGQRIQTTVQQVDLQPNKLVPAQLPDHNRPTVTQAGANTSTNVGANKGILANTSYVLDPLSPKNNVLMMFGEGQNDRRFMHGVEHTPGADLLGEDVLHHASLTDQLGVDANKTGIPSDVEHTYYYQQDELGSVTHILNATGANKHDSAYDEFGVPLKGMSTQNHLYAPSLSVAYTGHPYEANTGMYYAQARYYMPEIGRFISEDPWAGNSFNPLTTNPYPYVLNQPMKYVDPLGMNPQQARWMGDNQLHMHSLEFELFEEQIGKQYITPHNIKLLGRETIKQEIFLTGKIKIEATPEATITQKGTSVTIDLPHNQKIELDFGRIIEGKATGGRYFSSDVVQLLEIDSFELTYQQQTILDYEVIELLKPELFDGYIKYADISFILSQKDVEQGIRLDKILGIDGVKIQADYEIRSDFYVKPWYYYTTLATSSGWILTSVRANKLKDKINIPDISPSPSPAY